MLNNKEEILKFVYKTYGFPVTYLDHYKNCVTEFISVGQNGEVKEQKIPDGEFTQYDFIDSNGVEYCLVYFPNDNLKVHTVLAYLQSQESLEGMAARNIKEWEVVPQVSDNKMYAMFKLVPYTVQGAAHY
jgi:hypothetical protein